MLNTAGYDSGGNVRAEVGDTADLSRGRDDTFDVVFSNSVIEHLFTLRRQAAMAAEVDRVGRAFSVQAPSQQFPVEPHWRGRCFSVQFCPLSGQNCTQNRRSPVSGSTARAADPVSTIGPASALEPTGEKEFVVAEDGSIPADQLASLGPASRRSPAGGGDARAAHVAVRLRRLAP